MIHMIVVLQPFCCAPFVLQPDHGQVFKISVGRSRPTTKGMAMTSCCS